MGTLVRNVHPDQLNPLHVFSSGHLICCWSVLCTTFHVSLWMFCIVFLDTQPRALFFCGAGLRSPCTESSYLIWGKSEGSTQESLSHQVLSHCRLSTSSSPDSLPRMVRFYYKMLEISWNECTVTTDNCLLVYFFPGRCYIYSSHVFFLFLSISFVADFHFFPTLKSQQEGQKLVAWEIQNQMPLSHVWTSGVRVWFHGCAAVGAERMESAGLVGQQAFVLP